MLDCLVALLGTVPEVPDRETIASPSGSSLASVSVTSSGAAPLDGSTERAAMGEAFRRVAYAPVEIDAVAPLLSVTVSRP